jgi:hypothetical protein
MNILKIITSLLLTVLPLAILIRDWKFHDRRTKKHHNVTRLIIIFWFIGSIIAAYFVWTDSAQIKELVDGKNTLIRQNRRLTGKIDNYQVDLDIKDKKITELERKTAPRSLSVEQQKLLFSYLKTIIDINQTNNDNVIQRIIVTAANGNQEAQKYAMEFVNLFKKLGCESDLSLPIPGLRPNIVGMHIGIRDLKNIPEDASILSKALSKAGIKFTISKIEDNFLPDASILFVIGSKEL